jgi:hypothetical protein
MSAGNSTVAPTPALSRPRTPRTARFGRVSAAVFACLLLAACGLTETQNAYPTEGAGDRGGAKDPSGKKKTGVFGPEGLVLFGGSSEEPSAQGQGIGVNSFLWRASLDTVSFMPLMSADPFGGVIITDWHAPPEVQNERFKITVYILGRDLRADGVRAAVFRQVRDAGGDWTDAAVEDQTRIDLENAILTRARQLRIAGLQ